MARAKKPTFEYRWEAFYEDGAVFKRGPIRNDIDKVAKYASELQDGITALNSGTIDGHHLAPYWRGAEIRVIERTISPWTEVDDW